MTTGDLSIRVTADTAGLQAGMTQAAALTEAQMKRIATYVKAANDQQAVLGRTAQQAAAQASTAYDQISTSANRMAHAHSGVNRELIVLAHEMSQGNYSRFGGSMLVLAERTNALQFAMTAAGAATLGLGVALIGTLALIAKGAIDSERFARQLQLTGNYAAVTERSLTTMAAAQAKLTGQTLGGARQDLSAAAGSGGFGAGEIASVARAMGDYQKVTGAATDDVLAKFQRIQDGVAKWAAEENASIHFLTVGEYEHIRALEQAGQQQQAVTETLRLMSETLENRASPALGTFAREWERVKQWVSAAGDAIASIGRNADPLGASLAAIDSQLEHLRAIQSRSAGPDVGNAISVLEDQRRIVQAQQANAAAQRDNTAKQAQAQSRSIDAAKALDTLHDELRTRTLLNRELETYRRNVAAVAGTTAAVSAAQQKQDEAAIRKKYAPQGEAKPIRSPNTPLQDFRALELEAQKNTALWVAGAKAAEEAVNAVIASMRDQESAQEVFRQAELAGQAAVTKALEEQLVVQQQITHELEKRGDFAGGAQDAIKDWIRQASDQAAFAKKTVDDFANGMTDVFVKFAETGKLSFKNLLTSMADDIITFQVKNQLVVPLLESISPGGGIFSAIGSLIPGHANGLPYVPHDGYLTYLHEGEKVLSKQDATTDRSSRGGVHVDFSGAVYNVGPGVSMAQVASAVQQGNAQVEGRMRRLLRNGSVVAA
jgi:lambda family phage tail tape measure protein